ncbi:MAG: transcriptional regulator PpsR [Deltaproteobacteria bacterium]
MDAQTATKVIAAAADIALVIDDDGVIRDLAFGGSVVPHASYEKWLNRPWVDTVGVDSRRKVEELLAEAHSQSQVRAREINQVAEGAPNLPVRFSAVRIEEDGHVIAVGRDLRAIANLQQQLVSAQQSMEREYARLRHAETRYRLLFQIAAEGVVIVDSDRLTIVEANPVACGLLQDTLHGLKGTPLFDLFEESSRATVRRHLGAVESSGHASDVSVKLAAGAQSVSVAGSMFRQDGASLFLVRFSVVDESFDPSDMAPKLSKIFDALPDGFVIIDKARRIQRANEAFVEMVQMADQQQVHGEPLERWLGRPGVDLSILEANLVEHGAVRNFATIVRGEYGLTEEADVSAVTVTHDGAPSFALVIRQVATRISQELFNVAEPQSVQQLTSLVGRVSLKDIVRETTDLIEKLCIEAALEVSGDNRASAAQILGLSRQGLYAKLRRYEIGDKQRPEELENE